MLPSIFIFLLIAVCAYALLRGGRDERIVAITCIVGTIATHLTISPLRDRYASVEIGVILVDLIVLAGFMLVALRSNRFWPLWVSGLQLTTVFGHLMKGAQTDLLPQAYGAALQFWSYPIVILLGIGTWRHVRRVATQTLFAASH